MTDIMQNSRTPGWLWLDNTVIDEYAPRIGAYGLAVYAVLVRYADQSGRCFPAHKTLMDALGLSRNTIKKALAALVDAGLLRITPRRDADGDQTSHLYTLLNIPHVSPNDRPLSRGDTPPCHVVTEGLSPRDTEQNLINKTQFNNSESDASASPAPAPAAPDTSGKKRRAADRDPHLDHPAVITYRDLAHRTPTPVARASIAATVTDVARWEQAVRQWLLSGYRPDNIAGILDWYRTGANAPYRGNHHAKTQPSPDNGTAATPVEYDNAAALTRLLAGGNGHE